jgi:sphinganine-1-phosphate aldolase
VIRWTRKSLRQLRGRGIIGSAVQAYLYARRTLYTIFLTLPGVREKVQLKLAETRLGIEKQLVPSGPGVERHLRLPAEAWTPDKVRSELTKLVEMKHTRWEDGRVSGAVYHGGKELSDLQTEAFGLFAVANPIHPDVFPGVRKMEAEVVAMVCTDMLFCSSNETGTRSIPCSRRRRRCHYQRRNRVYSHGLLECSSKGIL